MNRLERLVLAGGQSLGDNTLGLVLCAAGTTQAIFPFLLLFRAFERAMLNDVKTPLAASKSAWNVDLSKEASSETISFSKCLSLWVSRDRQRHQFFRAFS